MDETARRYVVVSSLTPLTKPMGYDAAEDFYYHENDQRNDDPYANLAIVSEQEHRAMVQSAREASWQHGMAAVDMGELQVWEEAKAEV